MNQNIFKSYDIRGIYPQELDQDGAFRIGWAFGKYLREDLKKQLPLRVVVGLDMRIHSPFLTRELIRGLNDCGVDVIEIGRVPAPAFYYAVAFKDYDAGVMVTASHNPKEFNGFKFCKEKAAPISMGNGLEKIRDYAISKEPGRMGSRGGMSSYDNAVSEYVAQDLSYLNIGRIKPLKVVADPANCVGSLYLDKMFEVLPVKAVRLNWEVNGNMPVHEANPIKEETLQQLKEVMKSEQADLGIAPDGDGDRIVFLDDKAEVVSPAIVTGLMAKVLLKKYPGARFGYDLRMSRVVREMIEESGGEAIETRVGHSHIKELMREKDILFSGELSAHYYFRENYCYESPVFVAAQLMFLISVLGKPLSEIWRPRLKYYQSGEINFEVKDREAAIKKVENAFPGGKVSRVDGVKIDFPQWWLNVRPSNTQEILRLNLEAETKEELDKHLAEVTKTIQS